MSKTFSTQIGTHDLHHIWVRGIDLTDALIGQASFGEVVYLMLMGRRPDAEETRLVDAVLVSLVEHGLTPSAVVSRVTYSLVPEAIQGAVSAGLLGVGSVVLGSMEECGQLLTGMSRDLSAGISLVDSARKIVDEYRSERRRIPGVGHAIHTAGDPRAPRLIAIAEESGHRGVYVDALEELARQAEVRAGRPLPINVTGAVSAVLLEIGLPWQVHRGFALISRTAGLIAHIGEEMEHPITSALRSLIRTQEGDGGTL